MFILLTGLDGSKVVVNAYSVNSCLKEMAIASSLEEMAAASSRRQMATVIHVGESEEFDKTIVVAEEPEEVYAALVKCVHAPAITLPPID